MRVKAMFVEFNTANDEMFYKFTMGWQNVFADTNMASPAAVVKLSDSAGINS